MASGPAQPIPILLMSHSLGHGGGERQLALTALNIDRTRFEPHVGLSEGGFWVDRLRAKGVPFFFMGPRSLIGAAALRETGRLRAYIRQHNIRIVQSFDYTMNALGILAAQCLPGVMTIACHRCHMNLVPSRYRWLNQWAHRLSRGIVVNSEALRRHLIEDYSTPPGKIFTCYNGIDTDIFHPAPRAGMPGLESDSLVVGTVCVLRAEKNLGLLLEAFHAVAQDRPDIRLLITGSGPEEPELRALAERLNLGDKCVFLPSTPDVARTLPAIDIFVLPSLSEGLSNALMEAMACGCCVIASAVGGLPELVTDGTTGLLFPSRNKDALIERLSEVVDNTARRQALGVAAAERMKREFSLTRATQKMQEIYETVLFPQAVRLETPARE
ncbi:MAG TPA: glycosyltransferase [Bryobacteraceae bacterium]|jgi:glycosyltransferase involved in cell wall biosynthesis|nr:glycosyltransferase [Bryobacteraceae bacterium]